VSLLILQSPGSPPQSAVVPARGRDGREVLELEDISAACWLLAEERGDLLLGLPVWLGFQRGGVSLAKVKGQGYVGCRVSKANIYHAAQEYS
jgi:hypothetical protein